MRFGIFPGLAASLLVALFIGQSPGHAQDTGTTQSAMLANQKSQVLEAFLESRRVAAARAEYPQTAVPLITEARAKLIAGRAALEQGQISQAIAQFDAGTRALSSAVTSGASARPASTPAPTFATRRAQVASYLSALARAEDVSPEEAARTAELRAALERIDDIAASGRSEDAAIAIGAVYADVIRFVSDMRRGRTLMVRRVFETAQEEYAYEQERNRSYRLLVRIAVAERGAEQPALKALAEKLRQASEDLNVQAETLAKVGEYPTAIKLMERSTERLAAVLRASGVLVAE